MIPKISLLSVFCIATSLSAHLVQKFPFPLGTHALYRPFGQLYVGAATSVPNNDLAVAVAGRTDTAFRGITPVKVTLNEQPDKTNPLNGARIDHLALLDRRPVVIPHTLPSSLFLIDDRRNPIAVFQSVPINNALGQAAQSILFLTTTASEVTTSLEPGASLAAIAAVPNANGGFDGNGSGIALAAFRQVVQDKQKFFAWDVVDATTGASSFPDVITAQASTGNKAAPFGKDTPQVFISVPVSVLSSAVDLHFDRELGRLYIATQVTAGGAAKAGARAIIIASLANGHVLYQAIAPDAVFDGSNQIVGQLGANSSTSIFKVRTMQTSTYVRYLIVVGGNGNDPALAQTVFALPLVDNIASPASHGTLANVKASPITLFGESKPHRFRARVFAVPAQAPQDVFTMSSLPATVGGQATLPGPITDIQIAGEAVFVSCTPSATRNEDQLAPGIFFSQPVFDQLGRISGWTDWQRVADSSHAIAGFAYDALAGIFWKLPENEGTFTEVFRSQWTDGSDELSQFIAPFFNKENGGVQGLTDFPFTTDGFTTTIANRISVQSYVGLKKVLLRQTGKQQGLFGPFESFNNVFVSTDGSMNGFSGAASNLVFSGGELNSLGPISSSAVLTDGITGWFVVAGVGGIAILTDAQGIGWDAQRGLGSGFTGLSSQASWKRISKTPFVRKLIVQDGQLFALSQNKLERITISAESLVNGTLSKTVLAELTAAQKKSEASYSDVYLKGPLALLATSFGLLRSGTGADVRVDTQVPWIEVPLKESVGSLTSAGPVTRLFGITTSDPTAQDNIYLLNAYTGLNQALIYRLTITLAHGQTTDSSVLLFPDFLVRDTNSFFTDVGEYRNYVVTDGSLIALSRSSFGSSPPLLQLLSPTLKSGESARMRVPFVIVPENVGTIGLLLRNSASGAWMVPGDFGVRVQR